MFYVMKHEKNGTFSFMVNRNKIKYKWWTFDIREAYEYPDKSTAISICKGLHHGTFSAVDKDRALFLSDVNLAS